MEALGSEPIRPIEGPALVDRATCDPEAFGELLGLLTSAVAFLASVSILRFAQLGRHWIPRLPAMAYSVVTAGLGLPGVAVFGALVLFSTGTLGDALSAMGSRIKGAAESMNHAGRSL